MTVQVEMGTDARELGFVSFARRKGSEGGGREQEGGVEE